MRLYLSGPISSDPMFKEKFSKAQSALSLKGYRVVNPANLYMVMDKQSTWEDYLAIDAELLEMCDVLVQLPGWENSLGCQREYGIAFARCMHIIKLEDLMDGCVEKS